MAFTGTNMSRPCDNDPEFTSGGIFNFYIFTRTHLTPSFLKVDHAHDLLMVVVCSWTLLLELPSVSVYLVYSFYIMQYTTR